MNCPACGAAIDFSAGQDKTRCDYCGSALRILVEEGENQLQLLSQPELQRDFMPDGIQEQEFGAQDNKPDDKSLELENNVPDTAPSGSGIPPYPNMMAQAPARMGGQPVGGEGAGASRWWIAVVVAVVVVLCALCACIVGAVVIAGNLFAF